MKGMCTYTLMTKYVEDKWTELKTHLTKLVLDKSTATTAKLKADYSAKFSKHQDEIDALKAQVAALTARSDFDSGTRAPDPETMAASKPAAKRASKPAAKQPAKVTPQKKPITSPKTSKGVQKRNTYYRPSKAELQKRAREEAKENADYKTLMENTKDDPKRQTRSMLPLKDKRMHAINAL
jgi:hypothetical protein